MNEIGIAVGPIDSWPDGDLRRAHRLLLVTGDQGRNDPDLMSDIALIEGEIRRRALN